MYTCLHCRNTPCLHVGHSGAHPPGRFVVHVILMFRSSDADGLLGNRMWHTLSHNLPLWAPVQAGRFPLQLLARHDGPAFQTTTPHTVCYMLRQGVPRRFAGHTLQYMFIAMQGPCFYTYCHKSG